MYARNLYRLKTVATWALFCLIVCNTQPVMADFAAVGDVTSSLGTGTLAVNEAGGTADELIIGDEGTGGLLADGVAPFIGTLAALESDSVIIGNHLGSIGAANIEDFLGTDGNWIISGDFVIGHAGLGFLDFLNAAGVQGAPSSVILGTTYVGGGNGLVDPVITGLSTDDPSLGEGIVRINGLGSRLTTRSLIVGGAGVGVIEVSGRSQLDTLELVEIGSTANVEGAFGDGTISLTDLGTRWTARAPVTVGGAVGASHGKVVISNQAVFQVDGVTTPTGPDGPGTLTINPRGRMELAGGIVRMLPQASNLITNSGLIQGDGFIDGGLIIGPLGELRNAAGLANEREHLLVSEAVFNGGTIQSLGGAMEFEALVTNTLEIIARDAEMHFRGGVDNTGVITIGGDTTLHGDITSTIGGSIFVLSDSESLLVGDLTFSGGSILGLSIGPDAGTLDVTGMADLAGAILSLDYSAGIASQPGDSYQIFQADGGITGTFPSIAAADGRLWAIDLVGTDTLIATATAAITLPVGADFNGDGVVNELDLIIWETNYPIASGAPKTLGDADGDGDVDAADFLKLQRDFGIIPVPPIMAVPEPSTMALALLTLVCCPRRRRRS